MDNNKYILKINEIIEKLEDNHKIKKIENVDQDFYSDLKFDSLSLVELIMYCEHEFSITFNDDEIHFLKKVNELIKLIEKYKK